MLIRSSKLNGFGIITHAIRLCYSNRAHIPNISLCYVSGSTQITIERKTTMRTTNKTRMSDCMIMADRTFFRGISRINIDNPASFSYSFIFNKALELPKSPLMHPFVVSCSFPDVAYVLKDNSCSCFHTINNLFTNVVILPSYKPSPSIAERFELSFGRFCAFGLELTNQPITLDSKRFNLLSEELVIGSDSEMIYADVHSKNSVLEARAIGVNIFSECEQEEASSFFIYLQKAFFDIPIKIFFVTVWDSEWDFNSTINSGQTQNIIFERSTTRKVVSHTYSINSWLGFSFFDHSTGLFDTRYGELALQTNISEMLIDKRMKLDIIPDMLIPSNINTELQSFRVDVESFNYLSGCINFDFSCCSCFHRDIEEEQVFKYFGNEKERAFLPCLKAEVSCPMIL